MCYNSRTLLVFKAERDLKNSKTLVLNAKLKRQKLDNFMHFFSFFLYYLISTTPLSKHWYNVFCGSSKALLRQRK